MQRICSALSTAGFRVSLIGFLKSQSPALPTRDYTEKRLSLWFKKGKLFYIEYNIRLFFYLMRHKFDVYAAIDLDTALAHYLASLWYKKPMVLDAHELFLGLPEIEHRPLTKWIWSRLEKWIYPTIKKGYTVNESIANWYQMEYGIDMEIVRNCPRLRERISAKKDFILYQGALNEGRGLEELIEAMQWVDAPLKIAGSGEIDAQLKDLVHQYQLEHKIEFLGYLQPKALLAITEQAYIGVNLLKAYSLNYYYSLANKFFDYMHAGIPQISMNFPEYKRINQQHEVAVLLDDLNVKKLAEQLNRLIKDEALYKHLSKNCIAAKAIFNWENESKKLIEFYQRFET